MSRSIFIIAGEASGDMYGAYLIEQLRAHDHKVEIDSWGGDKMQAAGAHILRHVSSLSFMGFMEVLKKVSKIRQLFIECQQAISAGNYDAVIFIDFPGFNLRMAKWVKHKGLHTIQYISPKIWAWKEGRVKTIKAYIDTLICIFPFEIDIYKSHGIKAYYCGHPLIQHLDKVLKLNSNNVRERPLIALMPGSRPQEIEKILPVMLQMSQYFPEYDFSIGGMSLFGAAYYQSIIDEAGVINVNIVMDQNHKLISQASISINTSGTVTLECALLHTAQIVLYKANAISYFIAKSVLNIKYISLPNILLMRNLVPEHIQNDCNSDKIIGSMESLLLDSEPQITGYQEVINLLKINNEENIAELIFHRIGLK